MEEGWARRSIFKRTRTKRGLGRAPPPTSPNMGVLQEKVHAVCYFAVMSTNWVARGLQVLGDDPHILFHRFSYTIASFLFYFLLE